MTDNDLKQLAEKWILQKKYISDILAEGLNMQKEEIFYEYMKGNIAEKGNLNSEYIYFFHGYGCTVKNIIDKVSVDLEFGPFGNTLCFDKHTFCHELKVIDECEEAFNKLIEIGFVALAEKYLSDMSEKDTRHNNRSKEKTEIDECVRDRYILCHII